MSAAEEWNAATGSYEGRVRLWDVNKGESLAERAGVSKSSASRPGLAVRRTGKGTKQVSVAIAWNDEVLRQWDPGADTLREIKDGKYNNTAAYHADLGTFLTASLQGVAGRLRTWRLTDGGAQVVDRATAAFDPPDPKTGPFSIPRALVLFPSERGGRLDRAALIVRELTLPSRAEEDVLLVVDLNSRAVQSRVPQGKPAGVLRTLAASPDGRFLAVAGGSEPQIAVYKVADLAEKPCPQRLRSAGAILRYVAFATKGDNHGLVLNESAEAQRGAPPRAPAAGDLLFDFTQRKLEGDTTGWRSTARRWATGRPGCKRRQRATRRPGLASWSSVTPTTRGSGLRSHRAKWSPPSPCSRRRARCRPAAGRRFPR